VKEGVNTLEGNLFRGVHRQILFSSRCALSFTLNQRVVVD
jgi:hypothetical protein